MSTQIPTPAPAAATAAPDSTGRNFLYNLVYRLSIMVLPLLVTPYIARVLGVENNGLYSFSSTVACYFIIFGKLGLDNYGNRTIAFCRDDLQARSRAFLGIYAMQAAASLLTILLYIATIPLLFSKDALIYWMQLFYVVSVLFDVSWFFYGMERFRLTMARSLVSRGLLVAGVYLLVKREEDLWLFTLLMSLSFLLEQLLLCPFVRKYIRPVRITLSDIKVHVKPNLKLFLPILALSIYHWMDKIMLGIYRSNDEVAFYNYAESIISLPKGIVLALGTVMLPRLSRMAADKRVEESRAALRQSMKFISLVSCLLCFGIAGLAPVFVPFFLGELYLPTVALTIQLAIVLLPMSVSDVIATQYLVPFGRDSLYIRSIFLGGVVNLVMNYVLIFPLGAPGVVISTILANTAVMAYQIYHIRGVYPPRELLGSLAPFLGLGLAEFMVVRLAGRYIALPPLPLIALQLVLGGAVFLLGYLAYLAVFRKAQGGVRALRSGGAWRLP